jgi:3-oxoacyl-[acyl-carrier-protein] synthase I
MTLQALPGDAIVVTDRALVSALGVDAVTACAAARAGMSRARRLVLQLDSPETEKDVPLVGHAADSIALGFDNYGRLLRLLSVALRDLGSHGVINDAADLYLAVPNPARVAQSVKLVEDEEERAELEEDLEDEDKQPASVETTQKLVADACRVVAFKPKLNLTRVFSSGHTAFAEALNAALLDLRAGKTKLALVGAVESLITTSALGWLRSTNRLKTEANPVGLLPGEAACLVLLERFDAVRKRQSEQVYGAVDRVVLANAEHAFFEQTLSDGKSLAKVMLDAVVPGGKPDVFPWLITDLNGEEYRAREWGHAQVHLAGLAPPAWKRSPYLVPAINFGDTGAASAGIGMLMALHAFHRRCAPSACALVSSCSDGRQRSAVTLKDVLA